MFKYWQEETIREAQVEDTREMGTLVELGPWESGKEGNPKHELDLFHWAREKNRRLLTKFDFDISKFRITNLIF